MLRSCAKTRTHQWEYDGNEAQVRVRAHNLTPSALVPANTLGMNEIRSGNIMGEPGTHKIKALEVAVVD